MTPCPEGTIVERTQNIYTPPATPPTPTPVLFQPGTEDSKRQLCELLTGALGALCLPGDALPSWRELQHEVEA